MTQLVILCGGLGTRMSEVTAGNQKCLVPVEGRPFLAHILDAAAVGSGDEVLLLAGHQAGQVKAFANEQRAATLKITVVSQPRPNGTIAALREAEDHLAAEFALVLGDVLPPRREGLWGQLRATLARTGAACVMGTAPASASADPGNVTVAGPWITRYRSGAGRLIDRGCRYLYRHSLAQQPGDTDAEFFGGLAATGRLVSFLIDEPIVEVGTPERWARAQAALSRKVRLP